MDEDVKKAEAECADQRIVFYVTPSAAKRFDDVAREGGRQLSRYGRIPSRNDAARDIALYGLDLYDRRKRRKRNQRRRTP